MSKSVVIKTPIAQRPVVVNEDSWVASRLAEPKAEPIAETPVEPMKRFTIDVTEALHKRIKAQCAMRGVKMADVIRDMLQREFQQGQGA